MLRPFVVRRAVIVDMRSCPLSVRGIVRVPRYACARDVVEVESRDEYTTSQPRPLILSPLVECD